MQPYYRVIADSKDVTDAIRDRLLSLSITDAAGMDSDVLEIALDDRDRIIAIPRRGAELDVSLGYRETKLSRMGLFVVDEIVPSGPPATMTIRARAADFRQSLKAPGTRSWDGKTLGDICSTIAKKHGYEARVNQSLASQAIAHVDQNESDMNLLTRLAKDYGAVVKITGGVLALVPAGEAHSASGKAMPATTLSYEQISRYEATLADRGKYTAVQARWDDKAHAREMPVTVGSGEPMFIIQRKFADEATAKAAAKAKLDGFFRGAATLSLSCDGNAALMAESRLTISGVRTGVNGAWITTQVVHRYDGQGYRCDVEAESPTKAEGAAS
jgi:uncharacterized protein